MTAVESLLLGMVWLPLGLVVGARFVWLRDRRDATPTCQCTHKECFHALSGRCHKGTCNCQRYLSQKPSKPDTAPSMSRLDKIRASREMARLRRELKE